MNKLEARFRHAQGDFSLDVAWCAPATGVTALFGKSGSGKTTLLRCLAGLERPRQGLLRVAGETWQDSDRDLFLPVHRRPIGYVFQEPSLFDHLAVRGNLEYGWKRIRAQDRRVALDQAIDLLGIGRLVDRATAGLSGGERQRVAIARALVTSPRLLLMDEPLASLDAQSKRDILPYLERLHAELAIPVVYVSHSLKEVARLADHMLWLDEGRLHAQGPLQDLLVRFDLEQDWADEAGAVLDTRVGEHDETDQLTALDSRCGRLWVRRVDQPPGSALRVRLPARDISLSLGPDRDSSILNVWATRIESLADAPPGQVLVRLRCIADPAAPPLLARVTRRSARQLGLAPGRPVFARIKSVALLDPP